MIEEKGASTGDELLERLLGQVPPRPVPSVRNNALMRDAVYAEWRRVVRSRRRRRKFAGLAIAACVLGALAIVLNVTRIPQTEGVVVAEIAKSFGSIYVLGKQSELRSTDGLTTVLAGETITTDTDSGLALAWNNGTSVRLGANTRVRFTETAVIELLSGKLYLDSRPVDAVQSPANSTRAELTVHTDFGVVSPVGTQYMVDADSRSLAVSVREGRVSIDGIYHDATAAAGQQLRFDGRNRPVTLEIRGYGPQWSWVERTSPAPQMDGRTWLEFLGWVSRESGLAIRFASPAAEEFARKTKLKGTVDATPTQALSILVQTTDLEAHIEDGSIVIKKTDAQIAR